jgi:hypothetical protein
VNVEDEAWKEVVEHLVQAKRELSQAWAILDGTDGATDESEEALPRALQAIDEIYRAELTDPFNQDVAAPVEVQEFWDRHDALPGFALGT